ncbi:tyrosine recombinase XerS, partial [Streptococcus thoraltensis]
MKRELLLKKIDELKDIMPWFVLEYYQSKLAVPYSFTTLYEYLKEYRRFFEWLMESGISDAEKISDIDLSILEHLTKKDMESFVLYLRERPSLNTYSTKQGVSQTTINRTLSALSSLFKYLTEEVENDQGEPYFYRNVMKKVATKKKKETLASRAENIKQKLFLGDETMAFLEYVDCEYENKLSNRAKSSFQKNKERDLAIIALLLASGVRLSEAVNLDLKDLNLNMMVIEVTRKGGKRDSVNIAGFAKPYIE